jgi:hypothetical protein
MTFNDDLEKRKAIYLNGNYVPLSEVTFEQITDPKAILPEQYDLASLPVDTQRKMLQRAFKRPKK